jgi:hypothetical protein
MHVRVEATGAAYAVTRVGDLDDRAANNPAEGLESSAAIPASDTCAAASPSPSRGARSSPTTPSSLVAVPSPGAAGHDDDRIGAQAPAGRVDLERLGKLVDSARRS